MTGALRTAVLQSGRWHLRGTLSCARFSVRNLGVLRVSGTVPIRDAYVDVGPDGRPSSVAAVLELDRLDTGKPRRDADLRKPNLLGTQKFPVLTFTSGLVEHVEDGWSVLGTLDACGAQLPLALTAVVTGRADSGDLTVRAIGGFDRRGLGVRAPRLLIGRRIGIELDAVFGPPR